MIPRDQRKCPVCGDPAPYVLWTDNVPPPGCPLLAKSVTDCEYQIAKSHQAAVFRQAAPEHFDNFGNIKPNTIGYVIDAAMKVQPDLQLVIGGISEDMYRRAGVKL